MVRKIINCPNIPQAKDNVTELNLKIEFISPLFGGSSEKGKNDIREASIRGQLRFWWRATIGAGYNSVKEMREKEGEIFGNTDKASNVIIKIIKRIKRSEKNFVSFPTKQNGKFDMKYSYILFPFRDQKIDGLMDITFDLQVKILKEEFVDDVKKTLKAWINFGGLGSRTRKGLGSLYCKDYAFDNANELASFIHENNDVSFPSVNRIFYGKEINLDWNNWNKVVDDTLKKFRQGEKIGRNTGEPPRAGRSRWPEPEIVRQITGKRDRKHQPMNFEQCFPRAEFGLPIIIDFNRNGERAGEPTKTEIQPKDNNPREPFTRYASPLIIKNMKLKNGRCNQIVLLLNGPRPQEVKLKQGERQIGNSTYKVKWTPTNQRDLQLTKNGSAIEGFIEFIKKNGFTEINGGAR